MKRLLILVGCVLALHAFVPQSSFAQPQVGVSFNVFYDGLSSHGEWLSVGSGVYGWRPVGVEAGWRPYTVGRWCWTDEGWYWASDEPWGWAAYHYGRWTYDDYYGWVWIPGYDWAPAWVEWRYGGDYVGWAPLSPYAVFNMNWGIHYRTRWYTPDRWWIFAGCGYMASPNLHRYVYRNDDNARYIGVTRTGGSVRYDGGRIRTRGPERDFVERRGNVRIEQARIRDVGERQSDRVTREGNSDHIDVYRPRIQERNTDDKLGRPSHVREEAGRTLDLDTRKIDVRAREVAREEGRDVRRTQEVRAREQAGRSEERRSDFQQRRDDGSLRGPVDEATRNRNGNVDRPRGGPNEGRSRDRQPEVRPGGRPDNQPAPQREPRERQRDDSGNRSRREEVRSSAPPRQMESPRSEAPRNSGGGRSETGRGSRGR